MNVSFGSTYSIPISAEGINRAKKEKLRKFISTFENGLAPSASSGNCRVSIAKSEDTRFEQQLKQLGYKIWNKFDFHSLNKNEIDECIKKAKAGDNYQSVGRQKIDRKKQS